MKTKVYALIGKYGAKETAKIIGVSYPTLKKRLKKPDKFRQDEIIKIYEWYEKI